MNKTWQTLLLLATPVILIVFGYILITRYEAENAKSNGILDGLQNKIAQIELAIKDKNTQTKTVKGESRLEFSDDDQLMDIGERIESLKHDIRQYSDEWNIKTQELRASVKKLGKEITLIRGELNTIRTKSQVSPDPMVEERINNLRSDINQYSSELEVQVQGFKNNLMRIEKEIILIKDEMRSTPKEGEASTDLMGNISDVVPKINLTYANINRPRKKSLKLVYVLTNNGKYPIEIESSQIDLSKEKRDGDRLEGTMRKGVDYELDTAGITGLIHPGEIKNYLANVSFNDMSEIVGLGHIFARLILKVKTDKQSMEMIGSIVKGLVKEEQLDYLSRFSSTLTHRIDLR